MKQKVQLISKKDLLSFIDALIHDHIYEVVGVKTRRERFAYDILDSAEELRLDHDVTILPPKKYFLPQYEHLMKYSLEKPFQVQKEPEEKPRIIIGMHPYDIIALEQSDLVYLDAQQDTFYKKRRENTIIIGADIQKISERSFAASMKTNVTATGFDLMLTNIGRNYAVTIGTEKGAKLLQKYTTTKNATATDIKKIKTVRDSIAKKYKRRVKLEKSDWPKALADNYNHALWEERSDVCMECSSCTMVCPTCYCYDIRDESNLSLKDGQRIRTWDGCMLKDFTRIGSGEIVREDVKERYRHRLYRKGNYLPQRYGFVACVGCGRCGIACLPDIADPCDVFNELASFGRSDDTARYFIKQPSEVAEKGVIHVPRSATIRRIQPMTDTETLYELELDDRKPLGHKPGQFIELSIFGIGEAPFGVSSPPGDSPTFELVVRKVGNVTSKLSQMQVGEKVGIRGPFGNGFDVEMLNGKNILFTSGGLGLVPMRSLIKYVLDPRYRKKYKNIIILYGTTRPNKVMFLDEIDEWKKIDNVECQLTVDKCEEGQCWSGCIGLITTLFPKVDMKKFDSKNTIAVIVGPPIMYKFVIKCLQTMGIPDEQIVVSLERRMKCGVGKCGHCQINGIYTCKEGPVFIYKDIMNLPEAFE